jgi:hypothetical protein
MCRNESGQQPGEGNGIGGEGATANGVSPNEADGITRLQRRAFGFSLLRRIFSVRMSAAHPLSSKQKQ